MSLDALLQAFHTSRDRKRGLIVTGAIGSGKTQAVSALAEALRWEGIALGGVVSPRVLKRSETVGYLVQDLRSGRALLLCSLNPPGIKFRRFFFSPQALTFANEVLAQAAANSKVIIVDEVGPLELSGGGFAPGLTICLASSVFLVLTMRSHLVEEFRELWPGEFSLFRLDRVGGCLAGN